MKRIIALSILVCTMITGCVGNQQILDGITSSSNTYKYAIVKLPNGEIKEGRVKKCADYTSDALKIIFEDGTDLVTSYNCAVISKEKIK